MLIVPLENWQALNLSESEAELVEAVGEKAVLRQIVNRFNLSIPAAQVRVQQLVRKGALKIVRA